MNIDREDCLSTAKELIGFLEKRPHLLPRGTVHCGLS